MNRFPDEKALLRRTLLQRREAFVASASSACAGQALAGHVASLLHGHPGAVAAYCAMRGEPDPVPGVLDAGRTLALPVVLGRGQPLVFRAWNPGDPLEDGLWGTRHPAVLAPSVVPDVILVPVVGFAGSGARLGYGGGFYDRTLAYLSLSGYRLPAFAVAWECQRIDALPQEEHDMSLDGWITEEGFFDGTSSGLAGVS